MVIQQFLHRHSLVISDFKIHMSSRRQMFGTFFCQNSVKIKSVRSPVKSSPRFMVPHLRFQLFDNCAGDVGWVGNDHVELFCLPEAAEHVAVAECYTCLRPPADFGNHTFFRIVLFILIVCQIRAILYLFCPAADCIVVYIAVFKNLF